MCKMVEVFFFLFSFYEIPMKLLYCLYEEIHLKIALNNLNTFVQTLVLALQRLFSTSNAPKNLICASRQIAQICNQHHSTRQMYMYGNPSMLKFPYYITVPQSSWQCARNRLKNEWHVRALSTYLFISINRFNWLTKQNVDIYLHCGI